MAELIGLNCWASPKCGITSALACWGDIASLHGPGNRAELRRSEGGWFVGMRTAFIQVRNPYIRLISFYQQKVSKEYPIAVTSRGANSLIWLPAASGGEKYIADNVLNNGDWSFEEFCGVLFNIPHHNLERHLYPQCLVNTNEGDVGDSIVGGGLKFAEPGLENLLGRPVKRGLKISEIYEKTNLSIVKLENYQEDIQRECEQFGMDFDKIKLIHKNKSSEDHNINISTDLKEKIYDYYKIDFEELNYGK